MSSRKALISLADLIGRWMLPTEFGAIFMRRHLVCEEDMHEMKAVTATLSVRVLFGAVVLLLAFNLLSSAYQIFSANMNPSLAGQAGLSTTAMLIHAFLLQSTGYRLTMFVVALFALLSKRASHIFLFSLGVLVLNLYEIVLIFATGVYNFQLIAAVLLVSIAGYCLWHTKDSR